MSFDELLDIRPNIRLADLIQLFLLGMDDKIYISISIDGVEIIECARIIGNELNDYYDYYINYIGESTTKYCILDVDLRRNK